MLLKYANPRFFFFFFFNDTATTEIYTLSLHDALPISARRWRSCGSARACTLALCSLSRMSLGRPLGASRPFQDIRDKLHKRSEEHTSELQSRPHLVCRLLL